MNFLPIAIRELQVTARKLMTYYWRSLSALNAACITLGCLLVAFSGAVSVSAAGEMTFKVLSLAGYGITTLAAVLITADCISEERRDGTLGFLFLTDLKGYDIVLGKMARLGVPIYCLVAAFPALGFTMLLGGVSASDFARVGVALLNTLFFFAAFGLLISAWSWDGRAAVSASMLGGVIFSAPMLAALCGLTFTGPWMALLVPTPAGAFLAALEATSTTVSKPDFWLSLLISHALGWLFIAGASLLVTRSFAKESPAPAPRIRHSIVPNPALALHARIASQSPWRPVLLLAATVTLIVTSAMLITPSGWYDFPTFACVVLTMHQILKFWTANAACRSFPSRRQTGELEILLTTPLDGDSIVLGSTTAIKWQLLRPFLFVVLVDAVVLMMGWHKAGLWEGFAFAGVMLLEFLWFIGNLYSLTWVGLWLGLKSANHAKALGRTLFYILFLPWSILAVTAAFVGLMTIGKGLSPLVGTVTAVEFFVALSICNFGYAGWALSELRDHFRLLAAAQPLLAEKSAATWKLRLDKWRFWRWKRTPQSA